MGGDLAPGSTVRQNNLEWRLAPYGESLPWPPSPSCYGEPRESVRWGTPPLLCISRDGGKGEAQYMFTAIRSRGGRYQMRFQQQMEGKVSFSPKKRIREGTP